MEKIATLIINGLTIISKKIDALATELRNQKAPTINVPQPKVEVQFPQFPEIKMPEFPAFPQYPPFPEIPAPIVNIPEQKAPVVNVPAPIVNVGSPNVTVEPAKVEFPEIMKVHGMEELLESLKRPEERESIFEEISSKTPLSVRVVDNKGRPINDFGGAGGGPSTVAIRVGTTAVSEDNPMPVTVDGFAIPVFDTQIIDESAAPALTTITYKKAGTTVATKTITVSGTLTTIAVTIA